MISFFELNVVVFIIFFWIHATKYFSDQPRKNELLNSGNSFLQQTIFFYSNKISEQEILKYLMKTLWLFAKNTKKMSPLDAIQIQIQFLDRVNDLVPRDTSLVQELADLLNISTDSAYRRMRGETQLSFDETILLCDHYKYIF